MEVCDRHKALVGVVMLVGIVCAPAVWAVDAQATSSSSEPEESGFRLLRDAPQMMYTEGVPHIDHQGQRRVGYDPEQSFLLLRNPLARRRARRADGRAPSQPAEETNP